MMSPAMQKRLPLERSGDLDDWFSWIVRDGNSLSGFFNKPSPSKKRGLRAPA
jgi:hypothetical protein